jgi:hypothetical protein
MSAEGNTATCYERAVATSETKRGTQRPAKRTGNGIAWVVLLALAAAIALGVLFVLPLWVKQQVIARARDHGVTLDAGGAALRFRSVRLEDVRAALDGVPGVSATAPRVDIELDGLAPSAVLAPTAELSIDGRFEEVLRGLEAWSSAHAEATGDALREVRIDSARVVWSRPIVDTSRIVSEGATIALRGAENREKGLEAGVRVALPALRVDIAGVASAGSTAGASGGSAPPALGPWDVLVERESKRVDVRVVFDSRTPEGARMHAVYEDDGGGDTRAPAGAGSLRAPSAPSAPPRRRLTRLDANVPRTPLRALGIPPVLLGDDVDATTEVQGTLALRTLGDDRVEGTFDANAYAVRVGGTPLPIDLGLGGTFAGQAEGPFRVSRGVLTLGPLRAAVQGTVTPEPFGAKLDLTFRVGPTPCRDLFGGPGSPLAALGQGLRGLAQGLGLPPPPEPTGELSVEGSIRADTRMLDQASVTVAPRGTCGLTFLDVLGTR